MKIGIIGAGHIGGALTRALTALGYDVTVSNSRGTETLRELAESTGASAATAADAVRDAELVAIAVPVKVVPELPRHIVDRGRPAGTPRRIAIPVAADVADAKRTVMSLVEDLGFDAVDGGGLDDSWRQEPGTPVYGTDLGKAATEAGLAAA